MDRLGNTPSGFRFGIFEIDLVARQLLKRGVPVRLENHSLLILEALLEHHGEVVTREELRRRIWPDGTHVGFEAGLNTAISKLRYALGDSSGSPLFFETVPRRGYRFIAPVTIVPEEVHTLPSVSSATTLPSDLPSGSAADQDVPSHFAGRNKWMWVLLLLVAAVGLLLLGFVWRRLSTKGPLALHVTESRLVGAQSSQQMFAVSPDGRYVLYAKSVGEKTSLRLRQVSSDGEAEVLSPDRTQFWDLAFSPDGNYIYFSSSGEKNFLVPDVYRMPSIGGPKQRLVQNAASVAVSPDGRKLAFIRIAPQDTLEFWIANADGGEETLLVAAHDWHPDGPYFATWAPDGKSIVASFRRGTQWCLYEIDVKNHKMSEILAGDEFIGRPLFTQDGKALIFPRRDKSSWNIQLWMLPYPRGQLRRLTDDSISYSPRFDAARDGRLGVAIDDPGGGDLWFVSRTQPTTFKEIGFGGLVVFSADELPDGKMLAGNARDPNWIMNADGTYHSLFTGSALNAEVCGKFVLFRKPRDRDLWRADVDGAHPTLLRNAGVERGVCSAKDDFAFYVSWESPKRIFRIPMSGGDPVEVATTLGQGLSSPLAVSKDGKLLAYVFWQDTPQPRVRFVVLNATDGSQVALFDANGATTGVITELRWSPDNTSLYYVTANDDTMNVWEQPIAGTAPRQVTHFDSGEIFSVRCSRDGKRLILTRSANANEIVLLRGLP